MPASFRSVKVGGSECRRLKKVLYASNQNNGSVYLLEIIGLLRAGVTTLHLRHKGLAIIGSSAEHHLSRHADRVRFRRSGWRQASIAARGRSKAHRSTDREQPGPATVNAFWPNAP